MKARKLVGRISIKRIKKSLALLLIPLLMIGMLAVLPEKAEATAETVTVQFELGSKHQDLASPVLDYWLNNYGDDGSCSGSLLTLEVDLSEGPTLFDVMLKLYSSVRYSMPGYLDEGEEFGDVGLRLIDAYKSLDDLYKEWEDAGTIPMSGDYNKFYALWFEKITNIDATVAVPKCGTQVTVKKGSNEPVPLPDNPYVRERYYIEQDPQPEVTFPGKQCAVVEEKISPDESIKMCYWLKNKQFVESDDILFEGKMIGGNSYYVGMAVAPKMGYFDPEVKPTVKVNGKKADVTYMGGMEEHSADGKAHSHSVEPKSVGIAGLMVIGEVKVVHNWDNGKVTKRPTAKKPGVKTFTCKGCGKKRTETIKPLGVKTVFLEMRSKGSSALKLKVNAVPGAAGYEIYLSRCDGTEKRKPRKVKTIKKGKAFTWTKRGLKKNAHYKGYVKAYKIKNGKKVYIARSPYAHVATNAAAGLCTNPTSVTVRKETVSLEKGKRAWVGAKIIPLKKGREMLSSRHGKRLRYRSSNPYIATVSASGRIVAKRPGKCTVYVYAINGVCKAVKVVVK